MPTCWPPATSWASPRSIGWAAPRPWPPWPTASRGSRAVDKIVGPGNLFVALAKKYVYGDVDIDSIAGPSEVVVIVDRSTRPEYTAADLIAQAEHAPGASVLIGWDDERAGRRRWPSWAASLAGLERGELARQSLEEFGAVILARDAEEACALADEIAPEHLHIATDNAERLAEKIHHAGAIFLGNYHARGPGRLCGRTVARAAHQRHGPLRQRAVGQRFPPRHSILHFTPPGHDQPRPRRARPGRQGGPDRPPRQR